MWPFTKKKSDAKQPRKVSLINIHDYPKKLYSAFWEIRVTGGDSFGYEYGVRIHAYGDNSKILAEKVGAEMTRDAVDTAAQSWVLKEMKKYKRAV